MLSISFIESPFMKLLFSLVLALCLMTGSAANAATQFAPSQCQMLGSIAGEFVAREIRGEAPEKYVAELFPKFNEFPEDLKQLVVAMVKVVKKDRQIFPETANTPQAHDDAVVEFCFMAQGKVDVMIQGFEDFLK